MVGFRYWSAMRDQQVTGTPKFKAEFQVDGGCATTQYVDCICNIDRRFDPELHTSILQSGCLGIEGWGGRPQLQTR